MTTLAFDIETVPDVALGRRLYGLDGIGDEDVAKAMSFRQMQATGSEFLPLYQQRIVAISVVMRRQDEIKVWSLGAPDSDERELVRRFFDGIDRYTPVLVSWNGGGFDLPVLHYRALLHQVASRRYWDVGDEDREFRYNNYLGRFHWRHIDLMDVISGFQNRGRAGLNDTAVMLGFPGKLGFDGSKVWDAYLAGEIVAIRNYCETDALNTYLVYLRFELIRGELDEQGLGRELERVRGMLADSGQAHLREFLDAWETAATGARA
ncbi:MAG: 3'-5' exonuclease [Gammaproteobacteria bacterium]|nr:MAG: 3'-5' exonuclease [Gammaproteobacteria bacterium]